MVNIGEIWCSLRLLVFLWEFPCLDAVFALVSFGESEWIFFLDKSNIERGLSSSLCSSVLFAYEHCLTKYSLFSAVDEMWPPLPMKLGVRVGQCGGLKNTAVHTVRTYGQYRRRSRKYAPPTAAAQWDSSVRIDTLAHLHSVGVLGDLREWRGLGRSLLPPSSSSSSLPPWEIPTPL